jgi:acetyl-CoA carboxylase carboxyl transferase subunit beta
MSEAQGVNVASLYANGLVEHIIDERGIGDNGDAALEAKAFCQRLGQAIEYELAALSSARIGELLPQRLDKYRNLGGPAAPSLTSPSSPDTFGAEACGLLDSRRVQELDEH